MIVPMIAPDGKAVLPVDSIMRQVLHDCFMWTDNGCMFSENMSGQFELLPSKNNTLPCWRN